MARRKVTNRIPPLSSMKSARSAGSAWEQTFLGSSNPQGPTNPRRSMLDLNEVRSRAAKLTDTFLSEEIEMALDGDDASLLPYQPTSTIDPKRPRTLAAGYDERSQSLRIKFREGEYYTYYNVPPSVWWQFQRASSPGRYINTRLNNYPYSRGLI